MPVMSCSETLVNQYLEYFGIAILKTARKKRSKLSIDPLVMYFSENFNVVWISGVNVCPVFKIGFHVPVVVLKLK